MHSAPRFSSSFFLKQPKQTVGMSFDSKKNMCRGGYVEHRKFCNFCPKKHATSDLLGFGVGSRVLEVWFCTFVYSQKPTLHSPTLPPKITSNIALFRSFLPKRPILEENALFRAYFQCLNGGSNMIEIRHNNPYFHQCTWLN